MALTQTQIDELNRAQARLGTPQEGAQDRTNIDYAKKTYGYGTTPPITREGAGYNIANAPSYKFNLNDFQNSTVLSEAAKEIIQRKQNFNKDIQGARQWVRGIGADTSPFGGVRDPGLQQSGAFTDARLAELSPQDQASVRASRSSALNAYGQGLQEEATYRQSRVDDVMKVFANLYQENLDKGASDRDAQRLALEQARLGLDREKAGLTKTTSTPVTADKIAEALKAVASNGNYNAKGSNGQFGAYQIKGDLWDKWSSEFGQSQGQGGMSLNPTNENQDVLAKWKIQQLLNKGYSSSDIMAVFGSGNENISDNKWRSVPGVQDFVSQATKSLNYLSPQTTTGGQLDITDAKKFSLLESLGNDANGKPVISIGDTQNWSTDDWLALNSSVRQAQIEQATLAISEWSKNQSLSGAQIFAKLQKEYGNVLNAADLNSVMVGAGYQNSGDVFSGTWEKIQ